MFNPFVAGPTRMFVNTGAFIHAKVPNEMIGAITRAIGIAEGATAQRRLVEETRQGARRHASGAQAKLKLGTPAWLRADDIVSYKPPKHHERPVRRPAETFA
jgi:predicted Zn-dependent protease